jgi:hypothetical protein
VTASVTASLVLAGRRPDADAAAEDARRLLAEAAGPHLLEAAAVIAKSLPRAAGYPTTWDCSVDMQWWGSTPAALSPPGTATCR